MMNKISNSYPRMHGFPFHFPCGSDQDVMLEESLRNPIVHAIHSTRLHENEDSVVGDTAAAGGRAGGGGSDSGLNGSFALAVYAHPYTSSIASLWVYVAYLSTREVNR